MRFRGAELKAAAVSRTQSFLAGSPASPLRLRILLTLMALLISGEIVHALSQAAQMRRLEGRVVAGRTRSPVQGAVVTIEDREGIPTKTVVTNSTGLFVFAGIPQGLYVIRASHADFEPKNLQVEYYGDAELSLELVLTPKAGRSRVASSPSVPAWALRIPSAARKEYEKGIEAFGTGKNRAAIPYFEAAVRLYPDYAAAYSGLGAAHQALGDEKAASEAFARALEIDEDQLPACLGLGTIHRKNQKHAEAEKLLLHARELKPEDWRIHSELGDLYLAARSPEKAQAPLEQALKLHSSNARVHLLLINSLALQEKYAETLSAMDEYLRRFPRDSFAPQVRTKRGALQEFLQQKQP
jgi:tetratricopeptide (TPR) repeat protein